MVGTLVVTTTDIGWVRSAVDSMIVGVQIPQSDQLVVTERFTPTEDGARLAYQMVRDDPVYFHKPQTVSSYWAWRPDARFEHWNCKETRVRAPKTFKPQ